MEQTAAEQKDIRILAIESPCNETAAAVVENGRTVRSNVVYSQIATHTLYDGIVPEIASRAHIEKISQVTAQALTDTGLTLAEINAIGVTYGPGLVGPLLISISATKTMAFAAGRPLIGISHIGGHVSANFTANPDLKPPFLCPIVSGGHTNLVVVEDHGKFRILGQTQDNTADEAFDKVMRSVGLGYPGRLKANGKAREGNPDVISFPRAKVAGSPYDFSFSGLKSAVLNYQNHVKMTGEGIPVTDLVASPQETIVEVLVSHMMEAARDFDCKTIAMADGVIANSALRETTWLACEAADYTLTYPELGLYTDNTVMIGSVACYGHYTDRRSSWGLNAVPNLKLEER